MTSSITSIVDLSKMLSLSSGQQQTVTEILGRIPKETVDDWLKKLHINENGKLVGTFYSDIGTKLSFHDFRRLYETLGYDFHKMDTWLDYWYDPEEGGCVHVPGYTCET